MKITKIRIRNYLAIKNFQPGAIGRLNVIEGDNEVGKSSVLLAIKEVFKSSGVDPALIHNDADKAEIMVEIDDRIQVARTITPTANTVKVVDDGQPVNKPQAFLKALVGPYNFNPVDFFNAKAKERREMLLASIPMTIKPSDITDVTGLDVPIDVAAFNYDRHGLTVLADIQLSVFERRAEEGRTLVRLRKALEQDKLEVPPTFNKDQYAEFDLETAVGELSSAQQLVADHNQQVERLNNMRERSTYAAKRIKEAEEELARAKEERADLIEQGRAQALEADGFVAPDTSKFETMIAGYKEAQRLTLKLEAIENKESAIVESDTRHGTLNDFHKLLCKDIPRALLANVKLPIDGLEIKGDTIIVKGIDIDKLSTSRKIKFAVAIARASAGRLKIICIDRYESLGIKVREAFESECDGDGYGYFVTVVTEGDLVMKVKS